MEWGWPGEGRSAELGFDGHGVSILQGEKVLEIGCTTMRVYLTLLNCTLSNSYNGNFYIMCFYHNKNKFKIKMNYLEIPPALEQNGQQGALRTHSLVTSKVVCRGEKALGSWRNLELLSPLSSLPQPSFPDGPALH